MDSNRISDEAWDQLQIIWDYLVVESDLPDKADAIVIGGMGPMLDSTRRAAELFHQGVASTIVTSGFANPYHDAKRAEAEILAEELTRLGVPKAAIIVEDKASNTGENILFSARVLEEKGHKPTTIILVHGPSMTRRFLATALAQWPTPQPQLFITSWPASLKEYYRLHQEEHDQDQSSLIADMLGDYARIKAYPEKGFLVKQPVSLEAEEAFSWLEQNGFLSKEHD